MGIPLPLPKRGRTPKFSAHVYCGQTAGWIKMVLGMEVGLSPDDFVLDGDPAPLPKRGGAPKFSAPVYCSQTAGWIKMVLGMEVGLSPGDLVVLYGDPAPSPIFGPFLLWPNGCMHQNATWCRARPRPRRLCVRWGPRSHLPQRGTDPQFSAHICCGKWLHRSRCHLVWS